MEGKLTTRNTVLMGLLVLAVIGIGLSYLLYGLGDTEVQAQQGECPSPRIIDEITGRGSQQSPPFTTTTDSFRLSYETQADNPQATFILSARSVDDPSISGSVANADAQGSQTGETFANAPAGRYFLDVNTTASVEYTIRVEECGEEGEANPGEGKSGEGTVAPKTPATPPKTPATTPKTPNPPPPEPRPTPAPLPQEDEGELLNAGGPSKGPMPKMPNGSCPREFPEMRDGACYSA